LKTAAAQITIEAVLPDRVVEGLLIDGITEEEEVPLIEVTSHHHLQDHIT